jgi:serine protease AprX
MKVAAFILTVISIFLLSVSPVLSQAQTDFNAKVAQINIDKATLDDVIRVFGEPQKYIWGNQSFSKDKLPEHFLAFYPNGFHVCFANGRIEELRFEGGDCGYVFADKIRIGSSLDEVIETLGQPKGTVQGKSNAFQDGILYKDINGQKGNCYYARKDKGVRLFFVQNRVIALYVTRTGFDAGGGGGKGGFQSVQPIDSVKEFDDVRFKDLSKLKSSVVAALISTLWFNEKTVWPDTSAMLPGRKPDELLKKAMNPGLGVGELHKQGITGKGVNVAIIDQPLYQDHPEFAGKIAAYFDAGCKSESSMHGPAVASLLAGTNCGTAPDAKVYYAAAPSWLKDAEYYSKSIDWIIEQNKKLPPDQKIRVVSVSAAPSGEGSPFEKNQQMWDEACSRAEAEGMLVLDCTGHHGIIGACWLNAASPEDVNMCLPGYPSKPNLGFRPGNLLAPASPRTTAEQYNKDQFSYQYCGEGGLSWAIPYVAGVLAMGWQVNPGLGPEQMKELLFNSAAEGQNGAKIIDPQRFIGMVRTAKPNRPSIY